MKKFISVLCLAVLSVSLCSCFKSPSADKDETTVAEVTEQPAGETNEQAEDEGESESKAEDETSTESEEETTEQISSEEETQTTTVAPSETSAPAESTTAAPTVDGTAVLPNPDGATVFDKSTKGYDICIKDGITYVGGIMIANKSYALPETYNPGDLTEECDSAFYKMACAASAEGITLWELSGFRSYETQSGLYTRYCNSDGKDAADTYSARPGHSEHQTGLAIDVNSVSHTFADTAEGKWLAAHCAEYGFIIRYPEGKQSVTGYVYEPWHIRYIGSAELAQKITDSGLCLEEYLGIDSVYAQ